MLPSDPTAQTVDFHGVPSNSSFTETSGRAAPEGPGTKIGPYRLLQQLGEGGFGTVFLAEQDKPVQRKVALKIIKLGMDTREVVARFDQERQALAMMEHPNIARVLDAGMTDAGRPFFVMELVRGEPIVEYCDKHTLSIPARLELFAQVCGAVQHAHTKGIIHRDLKPSNVLVSLQDGVPVAKVIDFGIAKATAARLTEKTLFTQHRQMIGTPEYMSPEQAEGTLDIDTRTDVYSLGVMLYELLTGTTPFSGSDLRSAAYGELQRIIREVDPPAPSTRLSQNTGTIANVAALRRTEPRKLGTELRGELDWIVMKSLEKDRQRRYETASGLLADIRRYLGGEAVLAAPPSRAYRVRKFVRRHKAMVLGGSFVVGALVLGVIGTSLGLAAANRERQAAETARAAESQQRTLAVARLAESEATVKFLDEMLGAADPSAQGKDVLVRDVLARAAAGLTPRFRDRPLVAARLHGTIAKTYFGLGDYEAAEPHARESHAILQRELGDEHAETLQAVNDIASVLLKRGNFAEAEPLLTKAVSDQERILGRENPITLRGMDGMAQLYAMQDRTDEATKLARELLASRTASLGREHDETLSAMNTLALLLADHRRWDESEKLYEEASSIMRRTKGREHPQTLDLVSNFALMEYTAGMEAKAKSPEEHARRLARSRALNEETLEIRRRVLGEEHPETLTSMNNLASVYKDLGMYEDADRLALKDIEMSVRLLGEEHPDTIASIANMGNSLRSRKRYDEAMVYLDRALRGARKSLPKDATGLAFITGWYGSCLRDVGRFSEAEPLLLEARGIIERTMGAESPVANQMAIGLQMLYQAWDKAEPGAGHDAKSAEWKQRIKS